MPYIIQEARDRLDQLESWPENAGELNYCITQTCLTYLQNHGLSYDSLNEIIGVLECAKQEFYRRVCAEYENEKCAINGDVYE